MNLVSQKEVSVKAKPVNTGDTNNQQSTGSYDPAVASLRDVTDLYPCLLWMCGSAAACMIVRLKVYSFSVCSHLVFIVQTRVITVHKELGKLCH